MNHFPERSLAALLKVVTALIFALGLASLACAQLPPAANEAPFVARINEFPSLWQEDPRGGFKGDGSQYCAPVAVSNGLFWLAEHGCPNLLPDPKAPRTSLNQRAMAQCDLVKAITADGYAPMRENSGASFGFMARGLYRYISEKGYTIAECADHGITCESDLAPEMPSQRSFLRGRAPFSLSEIKAALRGGAVVILSLGRYRATKETPDIYTRYSGHAVTLVGYGQDDTNTTDPSVLVVHDPGRTRGRSWPNTYLHVSPLTHGSLKPRGSGEPLPLTNRRYIVDGLEPTTNSNIVLLDSVLILRIAPADTAKNSAEQVKK